MNLKTKFKNIGSRDFGEVKLFWQNFISNIDFPLDSFEDTISHHTKLAEACSEITEIEKNSTERSHYYSIDGLQALVLKEAVILMYKALNVLNVTEISLKTGFQTWSICNSYQSSYFSAKAMLALLGIFTVRINSKDFVIDLIPQYPKKTTKASIKRGKSAFELLFVTTTQLSHFEYWFLLQKTLRTVKNLPTNNIYSNYLASIDNKAFASQRNEIIYYDSFWRFEDLKEVRPKPDLFIENIISDGEITLETNSDNFLFSIGYILVGMNSVLLKKIAELTPAFMIEFEIYFEVLNDKSFDGNKLFSSFQNVGIEMPNS